MVASLPIARCESSPSPCDFAAEYESQGPVDFFTINDAGFAIFLKGVECEETIEVDLPDHTVIVLEPMEARSHVTIRARNIIVIANTIDSRTQKIRMFATQKLVMLGATIKSAGGWERSGTEICGAVFLWQYNLIKQALKTGVLQWITGGFPLETLEGIYGIYNLVSEMQKVPPNIGDFCDFFGMTYIPSSIESSSFRDYSLA